SRLTILNALDAAGHGAEIAVRTELLSARREAQGWRATLSGGREVSAKMLVNAAGPWVEEVLGRLARPGRSRLRLVKGSHIVVPRLWDGGHGYILQQPDRRVVFALPFQHDFTLIGTTDVPVSRPGEAAIDAEETRYLCEAADRYFTRQVVPADVVWRYSGVRALWDDGAAEARAVTRDYHLELDAEARLLSVFGGKLTTARALAEEALDRLEVKGRRLTARVALPGGDLLPAFLEWVDSLTRWLPPLVARRMAGAYGTRMRDLIGGAESLKDLGRHFGAGLYEKEVRYLVDTEYARTAEDILWRRTKLGLTMSAKEQEALRRYLERP
ncbi:MAG: glycerol-3-phosphate dehydrogenase, partial [Allosphingosinicella sp.]